MNRTSGNRYIARKVAIGATALGLWGALVLLFAAPLALTGPVLDCNPFAQAEDAIEPSGANAVKRPSGAPRVERLAKSPDEKLEQFARAHRFSGRPSQT